jgi:hypothetical protein
MRIISAHTDARAQTCTRKHRFVHRYTTNRGRSSECTRTCVERKHHTHTSDAHMQCTCMHRHTRAHAPTHARRLACTARLTVCRSPHLRMYTNTHGHARTRTHSARTDAHTQKPLQQDPTCAPTCMNAHTRIDVSICTAQAHMPARVTMHICSRVCVRVRSHAYMQVVIRRSHVHGCIDCVQTAFTHACALRAHTCARPAHTRPDELICTSRRTQATTQAPTHLKHTRTYSHARAQHAHTCADACGRAHSHTRLRKHLCAHMHMHAGTSSHASPQVVCVHAHALTCTRATCAYTRWCI